MDDDHRSEIVACTLGAGDLARRAARWEAVASRSLARATRTERGLRLVFRADPGVADELRDLVALERDCCAFANWSVHEHGAELTLDVSGDGADTIAAVQSLFPALTQGPTQGLIKQITVEPGITITAPRPTSSDIRRHKASNYSPEVPPGFT